MRVRLTVTPRIESPGQGSVDREAGENPARTRHCDRGSPPHARASHWSRRGPGRRGGVGPAVRRPPSDHKARTLVERGGSLQLHRPAGLLAGSLCLAVLVAAPAVAAAGPTVNVRVEGENRTLLERTQVTLSGDAVPGSSGCDGNSVGATLEAA